LTGGPWTNYIKGPVPNFEFTKEFIIIKVLTKITIKHVPYLNASAVVIHYEEALYQVYAPLPLQNNDEI